MTIIVDGMGGDHAPVEILKGCALAVEELGVDIIVTGPKDLLEKTMEDHAIDHSGIEIRHAEEVITMEDAAGSVLKAKRNSSMGVAFDLLKNGEGDAFVSAGNSGAILAGGTLIVKRIPNVKRAAFAPVFPSKTGHFMLIDSGANEVCTPEYLDQFGTMGALYMKNAGFCDNPRVGLLNNGTEETKGPELYQQAHALLKQNPAFEFAGNVEGRGIFDGKCDVIVADGFAGNILLKTVEGTAMFMMSIMKEALTATFFSKLLAAMLKPQLRQMKKKLDYTEEGGAVLLGISKPVIKAHGSSNAKAFKNAIRQAANFARSGAVETITEQLQAQKEAEQAGK
jgi:glycerol-3-phosphate acyltransferase PlsX